MLQINNKRHINSKTETAEGAQCTWLFSLWLDNNAEQGIDSLKISALVLDNLGAVVNKISF